MGKGSNKMNFKNLFRNEKMGYRMEHFVEKWIQVTSRQRLYYKNVLGGVCYSVVSKLLYQFIIDRRIISTFDLKIHEHCLKFYVTMPLSLSFKHCFFSAYMQALKYE